MIEVRMVDTSLNVLITMYVDPDKITGVMPHYQDGVPVVGVSAIVFMVGGPKLIVKEDVEGLVKRIENARKGIPDLGPGSSSLVS